VAECKEDIKKKFEISLNEGENSNKTYTASVVILLDSVVRDFQYWTVMEQKSFLMLNTNR
jgi:hypothetical protein